MTKLPTMSGDECITLLKEIGYQAVRQKGSHIRLIHAARQPVSVPRHRALGRGLLRKILRDTGLSVDEFQELYQKKVAPMPYTTDNAAMIGAAALFRYAIDPNFAVDPLTIEATASLRLGDRIY